MDNIWTEQIGCTQSNVNSDDCVQFKYIGMV